MLIHDKAFYGCAFFLLGVFLFSIFKSIWIILPAVAMGALYFFMIGEKYWIWFLPLMLAGALYFQVYGFAEESVSVPYGSGLEASGIVVSALHKPASQELTLQLSDPYSGKIKIYSKPYPQINYGSEIRFAGAIEKVPEEQSDFFLKDGIFGISKFPKILSTGINRGNIVMKQLIGLREKIIGVFNRVLPPEKSALIAGMTIGAREGFSAEFKDKMSMSGTTHIVALSGYNISIISLIVSSVLIAFLPRAVSFYLTVSLIALFVLMTGAEASAVRAAIMGILALFAKESERQFSMKNGIIFAAFGMVIANPRVLVFDLGFQLSFAALLGIVYVLPALQKIFIFEKSGIFSWKENALTTLSAQLAVAPLLLGKFGVISLTSIFANILILEVVPLTMGLGFAIAISGLVSDFLARMIALPAGLVLGYELLVIDLFSRLTLPVQSDFFNLSTALIYYLILFGLVYHYEKRS